jgi:hypothetical protein
VSDTEIIHFAGPICTFGTISRQRCQWCGALIQEYDLERVAIQESSRPPERQGKPVEPSELGWWGGLVSVDGNWMAAVDEPLDQKAPERSCMMLLPAEIMVGFCVP